jgi:ketosteroid isomerase-like protein
MENRSRLVALRVGIALVPLSALQMGCSEPSFETPPSTTLAGVASEVEAMTWSFHAADTAMDAERVVNLLWPEYEMLVDGQRLDYAQVAGGSRDFMAGLAAFHTTWSDLRVLPLGRDLALASFLFRDSIVTSSGDLIQSQGPTTLLWERRDGEWRMRFGDADHYPVSR